MIKQSSYDNSSTLYLIPTPIGNLNDITFRSLDIIKMVDVIFCEDTRETLKLLNYFNISKKLVSCHKFNENSVKEDVLNYLKKGMNVGLVSDQGCPIISDPGYVCVKYVIENGFNVVALPGASALNCSIMTSGIDSTHFMFYGFLDNNKSSRINELNELKYCKYPIVFYLSMHDLLNYISDIINVFGDRYFSLSHEISKIHESIYHGNLSEFSNFNDEIKGEYVLVVEGFNSNFNFNNLSVKEHVKLYLDDNNSLMNSFKLVAKDRGVAKSVIYKEYYNEDSD